MKYKNGVISCSDDQLTVLEASKIDHIWLDQETISVKLKTNNASCLFLNYDSENKALKEFKILSKIIKKELEQSHG